MADKQLADGKSTVRFICSEQMKREIQAVSRAQGYDDVSEWMRAVMRREIAEHVTRERAGAA